ncbi:unnamed protein product [Lepeophtheirus salmonis]|uniref:(salmon louse) hypothetical protein n=1 Tax=Lepeophtheirus salmonis TaxID=72036 RepID=A0A7R8H5Q5_LEPSM|nr:unnamed protein product [Lepeophtheirus salmonis]CAF2885071.1 unnamed protein product [Lepeophtheirus salmonis]
MKGTSAACLRENSTIDSSVVDNLRKRLDPTSSEVDECIVNLENELSKKEAIIRELELKLEKSLYDGEVEDLLRDEIESLKHGVTKANANHSKELDKIKKANEKVINEYKDANKELQKTNQSFKIDSSIISTGLQSSGKKKRRGKVRNTQNNSTKPNNSSSIFLNESNVENEVNDSERVIYVGLGNQVKSLVHVQFIKTKKNHVSYVDKSSISELSSVEKEKNELKETPNSEFLHSATKNTPRRSNRTTNNNTYRQYEILRFFGWRYPSRRACIGLENKCCAGELPHDREIEGYVKRSSSSNVLGLFCIRSLTILTALSGCPLHSPSLPIATIFPKRVSLRIGYHCRGVFVAEIPI